MIQLIIEPDFPAHQRAACEDTRSGPALPDIKSCEEKEKSACIPMPGRVE